MTLYALMDYLHAGATPDEMREWLGLTEEQVCAALDYVSAHRDEVDAEYQGVLLKAEERRDYWEARLREHLAAGPQTLPAPEKAALYAKLAAQRRLLA